MHEKMVSPVSVSQESQKGFTLIEVLVALMIISMITVVTAMSLRAALDSWERGVKEGEEKHIKMAIPMLMARQLNMTQKETYFEKANQKKRLPFCGKANSLSFLTSYAPMGSAWKGVLRVSYILDAENKTLSLYEQVITGKEDLRDSLCPFFENGGGDLEPMSQIRGINHFKLAYTKSKEFSPEVKDWEEEWSCTNGLPTGVVLELQTEGKNPESPEKWYFKVSSE